MVNSVRGDTGTDPLFRPEVPHPARIYNYWLGGKDHFQADRAVGDEVQRKLPKVVSNARDNRRFHARAVRRLTSVHGIRQFIDIGVGLPAPDNTHEVAQAVAPESRVVYVDNDPIVMSHARALLTSTPTGRCDYAEADFASSAEVLAAAAATLDFTQPVALLLIGLLHFIPDTAGPAQVMQEYAAALPPGSYIAITHLTADLGGADRMRTAIRAFNANTAFPIIARTDRDILAMIGGLEMTPPGLVPVTAWHPDNPDPFPREDADLYGGVART
jgi:S-adenosyl methyltransferase